ncbi:MAG: oligosaccharide flippase family protein [Ruthenibacterium sp.]
MQENTHQVYAKNAAVLTATGLILRAAGMLFRVYIAAQIGAAGMGLYQLIYTVYTLAVTLATAGLSMVAARITAERMVQDAATVRGSLARVLGVGLLLGVTAMALLYISAPWVAQAWLKDSTAAFPLRVLSPSLPFMAVSAVLRGYFLAVKRVGPNAWAQMFEQAVRIAVVMGLLSMLRGRDTATAVAAVVFGSAVSEMLSWAYMQWRYLGDIHHLTRKKGGCGMVQVGRLLAPIAAGQYVTGALRTIENVLVPVCLTMFLGARDTAVEQFGALKGMAMPVLFFPFSFISTLATLLLPDITSAYVKRQMTVLQRLVSRVLLMTLSVSILAGGLYTVFAQEIGQLLYQSDEIGFYLHVLGPLAPFMYLESMVDGILKGMNEQVATFRYTMIDTVVRIVLIWLLLPRMGMQGFLLVMLVSNLLTSLLNLRRLLQVVQIKLAWRRWIIGPALAALGAAAVWHIAAAPLMQQMSLLPYALAGGCIFAACYIVLLPLCGGIKLSDILPKKA